MWRQDKQSRIKGGTMKDKNEKKKSESLESSIIAATFLIESERRKEKEFKDYIYSELGSVSAGKRIILNSK